MSKIFANYKSGKGLVSRLYRKFHKLSNNKRNNPIKMRKSLNRYFSKKDTEMANKHMRS
jgi:hypothetical protein